MTYGLVDEDLAAASELIAEAYDGGRYVRARDAAMDLLGKYLTPDEIHDLVTLGHASRAYQAAMRREAGAV